MSGEEFRAAQIITVSGETALICRQSAQVSSGCARTGMTTADGRHRTTASYICPMLLVSATTRARRSEESALRNSCERPGALARITKVSDWFMNNYHLTLRLND